MSLVVETGAGLPNAESYISVADATNRHANLGNTAWAALASDTIREQLLRKATIHMEQAYRERWQGFRRHKDQALSWPRWSVVVDEFWIDTESVPTIVANTCADLALKAAAGDLNADITRAVVRQKVGPIEKEFDPYSPQATRYRSIDMALAPFLKGSTVNASLVRA